MYAQLVLFEKVDKFLLVSFKGHIWREKHHAQLLNNLKNVYLIE